jgi:hypothetical protein
LAVVQINDPVNSITFQMSHLPGDGVGVNIATSLPEPASLGLLALGALLFRRRSTRAS